MNYKLEIIKFLGFSELNESDLSIPPSLDMGDYSLPCFKMAKAMKMSPAKIAEDISKRVDLPVWLDKITPLNGYANFYLNRKAFSLDALDAPVLLDNIGQGKTVCIDYSSINIAKPLHIGHLPSTVIGGSLYRIFNALGYKAVGINHLGDYGTQFGKLISVFKRLGDMKRLERDGIKELQRLYVGYAKLEQDDPSILDEARSWSLKIEQGDSEAVRYFELFKQITLDEVQRIYKRLDISFDSYKGESFFVSHVPDIVSELERKGLLELSDGAKVVMLEDYNMPPCLILRNDGASLYATRDIAAAKYRKAQYDFDKCLYVVAYQQNLHFRQFFKVIELMGYEWAKNLHHIAFGMVNLEGQTLSTRKGNTVYLEDVLNQTVQRSYEIMLEKKGGQADDISELEKTAQAVGIGAVIFSALSSAKIKDVSFNIEKLLSFEGETGPYLQYTHARCCSVLRKAKERLKDIAPSMTNDELFQGLDNDSSFELIKEICRFNSVVIDSADKYEPCVLTKYLLDLSAKFNKFYFEHTILDSDTKVMLSRLRLVKKTQEVLAKGLRLILIDPIEKM